jgi:hypothetical protein
LELELAGYAVVAGLFDYDVSRDVMKLRMPFSGFRSGPDMEDGLESYQRVSGVQNMDKESIVTERVE